MAILKMEKKRRRMADGSFIVTCARDVLAHGWFLRIVVSRWRGALPKGLSSKAIQYSQWQNLISLPPPHQTAFSSLEKQCLALIKRQTHQTYWGSFLPEKASQYWRREHDALKLSFNQARDLMVSQYESLQGRSLEIGRVIGQIEWEALHPGRGAATEPWLQEWGERIWDTVPKKEILYNNFDYKAIEYRLLRELSEIECKQFVSEIAESFYQKVSKTCISIREEYRRYQTFRAGEEGRFRKAVSGLQEVWCFRNQEVEQRLQQLSDALTKTDVIATVEQAKDLMGYVVPKFSQGRLDGIIEGIKHE